VHHDRTNAAGGTLVGFSPCAATSSLPINAGQGSRQRALARSSEPAASMSRPRCDHSHQLRAPCPAVTGYTTCEPPQVSRTPPGTLM
jgi:hypothetical protein